MMKEADQPLPQLSLLLICTNMPGTILSECNNAMLNEKYKDVLINELSVDWTEIIDLFLFSFE